MPETLSAINQDDLWSRILEQAQQQADKEPVLSSFLHATVLNHANLEAALSFHLASKLDCNTAPAMVMHELFSEALSTDASIGTAVRADLQAILDRDSACQSVITPLLYFKGFHALQSFRVAHWLWQQERKSLALFLQNRISVVFGVDIHPAAQIGQGIMLDHATGIVIGETAVVEDNVSIMQAVTLGGTGKECGDRHPKIRSGVLISAGAKILGNIEVGEGAKVGAGSVVLKPVKAHTVVAGVPAKEVCRSKCNEPALNMDHQIT